MDIYEISKLVISLMIGGGVTALLQVFLQRRKLKAEVNMTEVKNIDDMTQLFSTRVTTLSAKLSELTDQLLRRHQKLSVLTIELENEKQINAKLSSELEDSKETIKKYITHLEYLYAHCDCPDDESLDKLKKQL